MNMFTLIWSLFFLTAIMIIADISIIPNKYKKYLFLVILIFAFLLSAFRNGFGVDYDAYIEIYNMTPELPDLFDKWRDLYSTRLFFVENGFLIFNSIIKFIFYDYNFVFFFMAAGTYTLYYYSITNLTRYWFSAFLLYISSLMVIKEMGQIRNGLAIAIALYSLRYLYRNKVGKFIVWNIIGFFFHKVISPIFLLPLFRNIKWKRSYIVITIIFSIILYNISFMNGAIDFLSTTILSDTRLVLLSGDKATFSGIGVEKLLFAWIVASGCAIYGDKIRNKNPYYDILVTMLLIGTIILSFFHEYKEFAQRLSSGLLISEIILLPEILIGLNKPIIIKYILSLIYILICGIYLYHTTQLDNLGVI